ncbi:MAG: tyrosine-type recombinase/integrase [Clostridia bacterium]|nr:tyrosine-type recombinase/integrase [Clostridia bacterium]
MEAQISFYDLEHTNDQKSHNNIIMFPAKNVFTNLETKSFDKPKPKPADSVKTLEEIEKIKKYFLSRGEYRNYCLFIIGITTGYRISDLLSLKFSDFFEDYETWKREIDITEQKTKKRHSMPISENIKIAVGLYIKNKGGFFLSEYIFKSQKGRNRPLDKSSARKIFNNIAKELNLPYHCSTHFLRKTFAYWFLQIHKSDMSALATLQEILNHSSEKVTLKYCGIEKERKEAMLKSLAVLW